MRRKRPLPLENWWLQRSLQTLHRRTMCSVKQDAFKGCPAKMPIRNIRYPNSTDEGELKQQLSEIDLELWQRAMHIVEQYEDAIVRVA